MDCRWLACKSEQQRDFIYIYIYIYIKYLGAALTHLYPLLHCGPRVEISRSEGLHDVIVVAEQRAWQRLSLVLDEEQDGRRVSVLYYCRCRRRNIYHCEYDGYVQ